MIKPQTAINKLYEWVRFHSRNGDYQDTLAYFDRLNKVLDQIELYKWHDLKSDPDDLPTKDGFYLVYAPSYKPGSSRGKQVVHKGYMFSRYQSGKWSIEVGYYERPNCVRAWREIEKVR